MSTINSDFKILRNQVDSIKYDDKTLKQIFQKNKYDLVSTLLEIEGFITEETNNVQYQSEAQRQISQLREIANEKDEVIGYIRDNFSN